jgi:hypothetical protein
MTVVVPYFFESLRDRTVYLRGEVINYPVNLNLCTSIMLNRYKWYPDNEGLPSIVFSGCNTEWVYPKGREGEAEQQADYTRVLSLKGQPGLTLVDHADGCSNHFCIGRYNALGQFWEYWTEHAMAFTSAGTVYVGRSVAIEKLRELLPGKL